LPIRQETPTIRTLGGYDDDRFVYADRVGTGFTLKQDVDLQRKLDRFARNAAPIANLPRDPGLPYADRNQVRLALKSFLSSKNLTLSAQNGNCLMASVLFHTLFWAKPSTSPGSEMNIGAIAKNTIVLPTSSKKSEKGFRQRGKEN